MNASKTRKQYREYIRNRYASIHSTHTKSKTTDKRWKVNKDHIRDTLIEAYEEGFKPSFMLTRSYHYDEQDRDRVVSHNSRINDVVNDFFDPRRKSNVPICLDHFMERHKDKLVKKNRQRVKDTIRNEWEHDWGMEIKKGGFHTHTLVSYIPDELVLEGSSRVRKAIDKIYGIGEIPISLREEEGLERVKQDLLEYAIRDRCDFIGNSDMSIDVKIEGEYESYDGYRGWKGMVAYVTKDMYNVDKMVEIYDTENNYVLNI